MATPTTLVLCFSMGRRRLLLPLLLAVVLILGLHLGTCSSFTSSRMATTTTTTTASGMAASVGRRAPNRFQFPPTLVPDQPFSVVWDHPSERCTQELGPLNFSDYGLLQNSNQRFIGDKVAVFYTLGEWPQLRNESRVNGGLPQLANKTRHLEKARRDIEEKIPDPNFNGLGVIDMELWRPLYSFNWGIFFKYKRESMDLVRSQHSDWQNYTQIKEEATRQFETAARELLEETLLLAREMRPQGRWGYYIFPDCYSGRANTCPTWATAGNDRLHWLYEASSALFPSPYLYGRRGKVARDYVRASVREGFRMLDGATSPNALLVPFIWLDMTPQDMEELEVSTRLPAEMGVAGVVVWGSSGTYRKPEACRELQHFLHNSLGPQVAQLQQQTRHCSQQLCSSHGRCVHKCFANGPSSSATECEDFSLDVPAFSEPLAANYRCRCYSGWTGQNCSQLVLN